MTSKTMKLRQLESLLEDFNGFDKPNIRYEQYVTPAYVAARMLHSAAVQGHIQDKVIVDLGSGPGILTIGSALMGANHVVAVDVDSSVFEIAMSNLDTIEFDDDMPPSIDFIQANVADHPFREKSFDVAVLNPPFGTKGNAGIDIVFLQTAIEITREAVYSLHKSSTRKFILQKGEQFGCNSEVLGQFSYDLPATYARHTKVNKTIEVDLFKFTHKK